MGICVPGEQCHGCSECELPPLLCRNSRSLFRPSPRLLQGCLCVGYDVPPPAHGTVQLVSDAHVPGNVCESASEDTQRQAKARLPEQSTPLCVLPVCPRVHGAAQDLLFRAVCLRDLLLPQHQ